METPWLELADPWRRRTGAEAVLDHLGFCPHHVAELWRQPWPDGIAEVAADALGSLAAMLDDRRRYEERLLQIMFRARGACAACSIERRRVAGAIAPPAAQDLCLPHYLAAIGKTDQAELARLSVLALRSASTLAARLEEVPADEHVLEDALRWLAGPALHDRASASGRALDADPGCPVCRAAQKALGKWLDAVGTAVRVGIELRGLLPLCPAHIGMCVAHGGPRMARELARQATDAVATALAGGLSENERADRLDREASGSVFYRRRSAAYVLGQRRRALRLPRCAACERIALACEHVQGEVLDRLESRAGREALAREGELCVRHFAGVYLLAPHGAPRAELAARQRAALLRAREALLSGERRGWKAAMLQLGGADG
ncbi:MAG: hypothetical protein M0015_05470 [Betaproteobacteria bacterium]|nr:hypothetical protein [Betaproteobacteria bacterium]